MTVTDARTRTDAIRIDTTEDAAVRRDERRRDLAEVLELDPTELTDRARLIDDLHLDSLSMMIMLTWLETQGVVIAGQHNLPTTVGEVLALVEQADHPRLRIRLTNGGATPSGPGALSVSPPDDAYARTAAPDQAGLAPVLSNQATTLTPITSDDIPYLYRLSTHPDTGFRWRYRGGVPPIERFVAELWGPVLLQFLARRVDDNTPVGHVVAYGADMGLRHAYVGAAFDPTISGTGQAAQTVAMFVRYLFHCYPLRKLYLEIPGFNWPQMRSGEGRLFVVEGILRGHNHYAGRDWDQYYCAIYRENVVEEVHDSPHRTGY
jgi:aryl carrier-like protein